MKIKLSKTTMSVIITAILVASILLGTYFTIKHTQEKRIGIYNIGYENGLKYPSQSGNIFIPYTDSETNETKYQEVSLETYWTEMCNNYINSNYGGAR